MTIRLAVVVLLALFAQGVGAATLYVRPGATGANNGADWTNAYSSMPTPVRGNTYYLADGSYGTAIWQTANSGTTTITIKKCTAADHGTETGYVSTYCDGQAVFGQWQIYTDYWIFDGQTRNTDWKAGAVNQYGITAANTRLDNGAGTGGDNLTFRYIDIHGGGRDTGNGDDVIYHLYSGQNITFQYCSLRDSDRTIFLTRGTPANWLVEYSYIARNASSPANHGEIFSMTSANNIVFRHNVIEDPEGTAVWAMLNDGTATSFTAYGNVIFHSTGYDREGIAGVIFCASDASNDNICNGSRIYNNTIWNIKGTYSGFVFQAGTDNLVYNNLWSQSIFPGNSGGTYNYNLYYATTADGGAQTVTVGTQPLVSPSTGNFALVAATAAGTTLASPYNTDPLGVIRGSDGVWDRGAYEFVGGGTRPTVSALTCNPTTIQSVGTTTCTATASQSPTQYTWSVSNCTAAACAATTPTAGNSTTYTCQYGGACTLCVVATNAAGDSDLFCSAANYLTVRYRKPTGFGAN